MRGPLVVKLGGSLHGSVERILTDLQTVARPLMILPGGGPFSDLALNRANDEESAHWMAIAGMEQFGWHISSYGVPVTAILRAPRHMEVLLPYTLMRRYDPLPHTWKVTSDTIAAWVARELSLPLLVLKSVDGIHIDGRLMPEITEPVECQEVDPCFIRFVLSHGLRVFIINGTVDERIIAALTGEPTTGTWIGATF